MISIADLKERVAARYPKADVLGDFRLRFVREVNGKPYAVCYFDLKEDLPNDEKTLAAYLDEVVGPEYFEGTKGLQWNNYLYFVTSAARLQSRDLRRAKELIEGDRRYARKFVITEDQIESVLAPHVVVPHQQSKTSNVY